MIEIENKLLSEDIFEEYFCCDLSQCKGACCVEGDSGAPLLSEEVLLIEDNIDKIIPYMQKAGVDTINNEGVAVIDSEGDLTTTLINGGECAFVIREDDIVLCAIEKAYRSGVIDNIKPISCHLYPIRRKFFKGEMEGLNYDRWSICESARECGLKNGVKVYQGVRSAIERAYGQQFYQYLEEVDEILANNEVEE